jgi:hypothetical protein
MFYEACRCGGFPEKQPKVIFAAVYHFGPRWEIRTSHQTRAWSDSTGETQDMVLARERGEEATAAEEPDSALSAKLEKYINEKDPSLEEIMALDPKLLQLSRPWYQPGESGRSSSGASGKRTTNSLPLPMPSLRTCTEPP